MPEGDTIFRAAHTLNRALAGRTVTAFDTMLATLARVNDDTPLAGRTVERVEARGKWLLIFFSGIRENQEALILATHMLMSGSWHIYRTGERWKAPRSAMRIAITCGEMQAIGFNVPVAEFHTPRSFARHSQINTLGADILGGGFSVEAGVRALADYGLAHPEAEIANVLLNQRVLAGLGNVYKSEVAFAAGVNPFRRMRTLTAREMQQLIDAAHRFMRSNVEPASGAGIVTYTGNRRTTHQMDRNHRLWVYGRQGQECRRCGTLIETRKQGSGARSTFWCPQCQPWISAEIAAEAQPIDAPAGRSEMPLRRRRASC
jgi:endonuclease-8